MRLPPTSSSSIIYHWKECNVQLIEYTAQNSPISPKYNIKCLEASWSYSILHICKLATISKWKPMLAKNEAKTNLRSQAGRTQPPLDFHHLMELHGATGYLFLSTSWLHIQANASESILGPQPASHPNHLRPPLLQLGPVFWRADRLRVESSIPKEGGKLNWTRPDKMK